MKGFKCWRGNGGDNKVDIKLCHQLTFALKNSQDKKKKIGKIETDFKVLTVRISSLKYGYHPTEEKAQN